MDALKRGAVPALVTLFLPGHLLTCSRSRGRWWLLAGLLPGAVG